MLKMSFCEYVVSFLGQILSGGRWCGAGWARRTAAPRPEHSRCGGRWRTTPWQSTRTSRQNSFSTTKLVSFFFLTRKKIKSNAKTATTSTTLTTSTTTTTTLTTLTTTTTTTLTTAKTSLARSLFRSPTDLKNKTEHERVQWFRSKGRRRLRDSSCYDAQHELKEERQRAGGRGWERGGRGGFRLRRTYPRTNIWINNWKSFYFFCSCPCMKLWVWEQAFSVADRIHFMAASIVDSHGWNVMCYKVSIGMSPFYLYRN